MNFKRLIVTIFVFLLITAMVMPLINAFEATQNPTKSTSTNNFNNADYAYSDGDGYANTVNPTQNATYYGYNFNIAAGNLVNGITVQLDAWQSGGAGKGYLDVQLSNDGGSTWTTARRIPSTGFLATTETTYYAGDSSDTWGLSWTIAQLNSDASRVRVTAQKDGGSNPAWRLDWIPVTVTYSEPTQTDTTPPTTAISLSGTPGNNGWYKSNVRNLIRRNNTGGSGNKEIHYIINSGTEVTNTSNPTVFTSIRRHKQPVILGVDNAETTRSRILQHKIDKTLQLLQLPRLRRAKYVLNQRFTLIEAQLMPFQMLPALLLIVASGIQIDTSTIGTHSFTISAEDNAGNTKQRL